MENENRQVTYNSSYTGDTLVTLDIQQYIHLKHLQDRLYRKKENLMSIPHG